jgi:hypothetical protein
MRFSAQRLLKTTAGRRNLLLPCGPIATNAARRTIPESRRDELRRSPVFSRVVAIAGALRLFRLFISCRTFLLAEGPETRAKRAGPFPRSTKEYILSSFDRIQEREK